jgi:CO/xanthine dehydrogenase Mo-binding subunit
MKIGESVPRYDGWSKVTGREKYAADYYGPDFLWAGVKRAGIPHGRLLGIDTERVRTLSGVVAVLTHADVPGPNRQGVVRQDQPILVDEKIRHCGDAVALVLARDRRTLKKAVDLISLDVEPLPGVFDVEAALAADAPLVHEDLPSGNLLRHVAVTKGQGDKGFDLCDVVVEFSCETPRQEHAFLETQAGWAFSDRVGKIVIIASTQTPFRDRQEAARALGLDSDGIRVIAPYLGGAFGGKDGLTVQALLALAVLNSGGRPVKMWWDREESFLAGVKRLPARMYYRIGARSDGAMIALGCRLYFDSGPYAGLSGEIMTMAVEHAGGPYRIPHVQIDGFCVHTNNPVGGPFRGFGVPQVTAAMEQTVDILAEKLHMDPLTLRMRNALTPGDKNCIGVAMVHSMSVRECLSALAGHPLWKEREAWRRAAGPFKRRGVGVACLSHAMGYPKDVPDQAGAKVEVTSEDTIRIYAGVSDMGQGNAATYMQIAGHILHQDACHLDLVLPDTERTLPCGSASASRCTYVYGNALIEAATALKRRVLEKAALLFPAPVEELTLEPGCVLDRATGKTVALARISAALSEERFVECFYRAPVAEESSGLIYMGPHALFSYGAHLARVEVDELTGATEVKDYLAATDAGRVINPQLFEGQIEGAVAQGLGYALTELFTVEKGAILSANLATYTVPTALDVPDVVSLTVDETEETGPFGMKGAGEIGVSGPFPAVANAVAQALGRRIETGPFTGERLLLAGFKEPHGRGGPRS